MEMTSRNAESILASRRDLIQGLPAPVRSDDAAEGGCGVLGLAASLRVPGRHVLAGSQQMHNRGNGKGGGIAMVGLDPAQVKVDAQTLSSHYLLQIALLDPEALGEVESGFITPHFEIAQAYELEHLDDYREIPGLEVRPPDVWRYFVRVRPQVLEHFAKEKGLQDLPARALEDEFVYQNSFKLNREFYASLGEQRAFVLSHGRNLSVLKIVGYAEDVAAYYRLEDQTANVWIAHQRYPTKGRVWHPGGAHPFIGLNEALVHNGDFANYHAVSEYLRQRNIGQLFLTDTEVSAQLFDLWNRVYGYPLEITLEAMAPTTEHDFWMLPAEKRELYHAVQRVHMHGSPDGPWFFILARSLPGDFDQADRFELLGITDTSMLRPQVFALYENHPQPANETVEGTEGVQIGLIASERQAINACLRSLAAEDMRFQPAADRYWAARGGSYTDGGAFRFTVTSAYGSGPARVDCVDKFGVPVTLEGEASKQHVDRSQLQPECASPEMRALWEQNALRAFDNGGPDTFLDWFRSILPDLGWDELAWGLKWLLGFAAQGDQEWEFSLGSLTLLHDRRLNRGNKRRASYVTLVRDTIDNVLSLPPSINLFTEDGIPLQSVRRLTWDERYRLVGPQHREHILVIDTLGFPAEGEDSAARWMARAVEQGWKRLIAYRWRGGRFAACGLGPGSAGVRIDLYGDVGDYAGSGLDGAEVHLHGDAQDQVGQILKQGKLVIYGDVGQTFLYGAKGGEVYVLGSAAGRPLINAVGRPRVVINGVCLDYLAESFMAGDPLLGGGFAILNGIAFDADGNIVELETPYPGGNLFSLASGGAIYLRDPHCKVQEDQLNGGAFVRLKDADWALIEPYLLENKRLFGIGVEELLTVDGIRREPAEVYRKVEVLASSVLHESENR
ncbi:MAG: glutamate synthase [Chloroflexi bacterium]|nr:glutamate synthase [Chloroflexota bacterium]